VSAAPFRLDGELALVTGGGTGLGLGIARCLAAAGARVVLAGRRADVLADAVAALGDGARALPLDVTDRASLPGAVAALEAREGPLAVLVNNAGNHWRAPAAEHDDEAFSAVLDVHLAGGFALARAVGARMLARGTGSIVFISSLNARIGMPGTAGYAAAKAGVDGLVTALGAEWAPGGVRVNAVLPGWIDAGMARRALGADPARRARALARIPLGRLGAAEDVGWAVTYLCSPAAAYVTGAVLPVDGGALIGF